LKTDGYLFLAENDGKMPHNYKKFGGAGIDFMLSSSELGSDFDGVKLSKTKNYNKENLSGCLSSR